MTTEAFGKFRYEAGKKIGLGVYYISRDLDDIHSHGFYEYRKPNVCEAQEHTTLTGLDLLRELIDCKTSAFPPV